MTETFLYYRCEIAVSTPNLLGEVNKVARDHLRGDSAEYYRFRCRGCGQLYTPCESDKHYPGKAACPNCYSENLFLAVIKVAYEDWGPNNGGTQERDKRMQHAITKHGAVRTYNIKESSC